MMFSIKKSSLLKSGFAIAAMAIAVTNYSQSNQSYSALTPKIIEAKANTEPVNEDVDGGGGGGNPCATQVSSTCKFTTSDNIPHETSNAKNN